MKLNWFELAQNSSQNRHNVDVGDMPTPVIISVTTGYIRPISKGQKLCTKSTKSETGNPWVKANNLAEMKVFGRRRRWRQRNSWSWNLVCHIASHDDVIKWKHFPRHWPFMRGIHRPPVNSLHKSQWRRALMFSLICVWISGWVNNREDGDLRRHRPHYDVTVMILLGQRMYWMCSKSKIPPKRHGIYDYNIYSELQ